MCDDLLSFEKKKGQVCYLCGSKDGYCIQVYEGFSQIIYFV